MAAKRMVMVATGMVAMRTALAAARERS